jgi:hypothetical protein
MGHNEDCLTHCGSTVPSIGQIEQTATDHVNSDVGPGCAQVISAGSRNMEHNAGVAAAELDVSVVKPVEQWTDLIICVGDEAVE